jgi:hypothetical protein
MIPAHRLKIHLRETSNTTTTIGSNNKQEYLYTLGDSIKAHVFSRLPISHGKCSQAISIEISAPAWTEKSVNGPDSPGIRRRVSTGCQLACLHKVYGLQRVFFVPSTVLLLPLPPSPVLQALFYEPSCKSGS